MRDGPGARGRSIPVRAPIARRIDPRRSAAKTPRREPRPSCRTAPPRSARECRTARRVTVHPMQLARTLDARPPHAGETRAYRRRVRGATARPSAPRCRSPRTPRLRRRRDTGRTPTPPRAPRHPPPSRRQAARRLAAAAFATESCPSCTPSRSIGTGTGQIGECIQWLIANQPRRWPFHRSSTPVGGPNGCLPARRYP